MDVKYSRASKGNMSLSIQFTSTDSTADCKMAPVLHVLVSMLLYDVTLQFFSCEMDCLFPPLEASHTEQSVRSVDLRLPLLLLQPFPATMWKKKKKKPQESACRTVKY